MCLFRMLVRASIAHAILLNRSFDLPGRAIALNMMQWNGAHVSLYCEDVGTTIGGDHLHVPSSLEEYTQWKGMT